MQKNQLQVMKYKKSLSLSYTNFFSNLIQTYGSVVKVNHKESGDMGLIPTGCWNPLPPLGHFVWHWASQCSECNDTCAFYIAVLSIIFWFLGFCQWQSSTDGVVNLNTTMIALSDFHCFGTWIRALAAWPALSCSLAYMCWPGIWAEIVAIVDPWSWLTARSVALFFPDF